MQVQQKKNCRHTESSRGNCYETFFQKYSDINIFLTEKNSPRTILFNCKINNVVEWVTLLLNFDICRDPEPFLFSPFPVRSRIMGISQASPTFSKLLLKMPAKHTRKVEIL